MSATLILPKLRHEPLFHAISSSSRVEAGVPEPNNPGLRIARRFIEAGASLVTDTDIGVYPLHQATLEGAPLSFIEFLLMEKRAEPNFPNDFVFTAGYYLGRDMARRLNNNFDLGQSNTAVYKNTFDLTRLLVQYGLRLDYRGAQFRNLGWELKTGQRQVHAFVFMWLANGACLNGTVAEIIKTTWHDEHWTDIPKVIDVLKGAQES